MTSSRPYLIRALYEWILDNGLTPHVLVDAEHPQATVPGQFVENGQIVLNISPTAVMNLQLGNEDIRFSARFSGIETPIHFPPSAVLGIYAKENSRGMLFPREPGEQGPDDTPDPSSPTPQRPALKVVK